MELEKEVLDAYAALSAAHEKYLRAYGVKLPKLSSRGVPTAGALTLCYLYMHLGKPVTKTELTEFVQKYRKTNDLQAARHLGNGGGWNILTARRKDARTQDWPSNSYGLMSVTQPYPRFRQSRVGTLTEEVWQAILEENQFRCVSCGSTRGQANFRNSSVITKLQQGHRDPHKDLSAENCIPQCQLCNQTARDSWVWDEDGRPFAVADAQVVLRSSEKVQREMYDLLRDALDEKS